MYPLIEAYGISSPYGPREGGFHAGCDMPCPAGTPVPSVAAGTVQFAGWIPGAYSDSPQELIMIVQSNGYFIVYGHLQATLKSAGNTVSQGEIIAHTGYSGYVLPPGPNGRHIHIEKRLGTKVNALPLSRYQSVDITPELEAYGGSDMTIIVKPITTLKAELKKPIMMYDFEHNTALWESGLGMTLTQKTNVIWGSTFYVPADRAESGEL